MQTMKHPIALLALLTIGHAAHAQNVVPPLPASSTARLNFEEASGLDGNQVAQFAQARPDEKRDRNAPRPADAPRPPAPPTPPPPPGEAPGGFGHGESRASSMSGSARSFGRPDGQRGRPAHPIVVTSQPLEAKQLATIEEDLGIMARLLEKEIEREGGAGAPRDAMGIVLTRLDGRSPSVLLLEGYGAVFTFNVRMPLTPPPVRATEKKPERPTDSPWERTRRELFGAAEDGSGRGGLVGGQAGRFEFRAPPGAGISGGGGGGVFGDSWGGRIAGPEPYDANKVEELKKSILEALKQAGNIRALKPDDYLTVVVQGGDGGLGSPGFVSVETRTMTSTGSGGGPPKVETFVNRGSGSGHRSSTLTVRAKKSDCDDFAKGKLNAEQFTKKALVNLQ